MVEAYNSDENENNENTDKTDLSDEGALEASEGGDKPEEDQLMAESEAPSDEESDDSVQDSGDSMENVMNLYEESFKRFAEGEVVTGLLYINA